MASQWNFSIPISLPNLVFGMTHLGSSTKYYRWLRKRKKWLLNLVAMITLGNMQVAFIIFERILLPLYNKGVKPFITTMATSLLRSHVFLLVWFLQPVLVVHWLGLAGSHLGESWSRVAQGSLQSTFQSNKNKWRKLGVIMLWGFVVSFSKNADGCHILWCFFLFWGCPASPEDPTLR